MISFRQFLAEETSAADEISAMIKRDCAPWLAESGGKIAYRGMNPKSTPKFGGEILPGVYAMTARKDRKPKDSPLWLHDAMNASFVKHIGIPLRSEAVFVTGSLSIASSYMPTIYKIFPIGKFQYAWDPIIKDPTHAFALTYDDIQEMDETQYSVLKKKFTRFWAKNTDIHGMQPNFRDAEIEYGHMMPQRPGYKKAVSKFIMEEDLWKFNTDLKTALTPTRKTEVMIACDQYYAVHENIKLKL